MSRLKDGGGSCRLVAALHCAPATKCLAAFALFFLAAFVQPVWAQIPTGIGWSPLPTSTSLEGSGACPPNNFGGDAFQFAELCANVIRTWNGAIADTNANRLIIWGGGHDNYYGNEIYALNLTANPITLVRLKDPTVPTNFANMANCIDTIPPGTETAPNSREGYEGLEFLPGPNRMMILNGSVACGNGNGSVNTWTISLQNVTDATPWVHEDATMTIFNGFKPGYSNQNSYGNIAVYDPNSGLVIVSDNSALFSYDYQTNTYNMITAPEGFDTSIYLSGVIDPVRRLFVAMGGCSVASGCGPGFGVFVADISNPSGTTTTSMQNWTAATLKDSACAEFLTGGVNPISSSNPGIVYDPVAGDFVGWPNQGNTVYTMTPDITLQQLHCTRVTFPNGPPNSAHANQLPNTSYGTFGRFRYFSALDVFVLVNDWNIPPYTLRLRGSASSPSYTLSANPATATATGGGTANYSVTVNAVGSFTGTVNLSVSGLPSGATSSFSPTSINTSGTSTLTVSIPTSSAGSSSTLTITGTSGSLTQSANVTLVVTVPDFTLSATPSSVTVSPGAIAIYAVSAGALNGFTGTVSLSATGLPAGAVPSFGAGSISAGASSTLNVATSTSLPAGSYPFTVTGTNGSLSHSAKLTFVVSTTKKRHGH